MSGRFFIMPKDDERPLDMIIGQLEYDIWTAMRDLERIVGFGNTRETVALMLNRIADRKTIDA